MTEIIFYSVVGTLAFALLNWVWIWLLTKAEASRTESERIERHPATGIMGAAFQLERSGD